MFLGDYTIDSTVPFNFQALDGHGQAVNADQPPTYAVYVNNAPMVPPVTGQMTPIDGQTGFYGAAIGAHAAGGFAAGNTYTIRITAVIDGVTTLTTHTFYLAANPATTLTATFEPIADAPNQIPVDADNPFDAALINAGGAFKKAFGRPVVLLPDGVTERAVTAIVSYEQIEPVPGLPHGKSQRITVQVDNNAATGLSAAEFDGGLAKVRIPERLGAEPVEKRLVRILAQDAGMITCEVQ